MWPGGCQNDSFICKSLVERSDKVTGDLSTTPDEWGVFGGNITISGFVNEGGCYTTSVSRRTPRPTLIFVHDYQGSGLVSLENGQLITVN